MKFSQTGVNKYLFERVSVTARCTCGSTSFVFSRVVIKIICISTLIEIQPQIIYGKGKCFYLTFNLYVSFKLTSVPSVGLRYLTL